jgi:hypothetical protein
MAAAVVLFVVSFGRAAEEAEPAWAKSYSYFVGEWRCTLTDGRSAEYQCRLSPTKTCFIEYLSINKEPSWHGVAGYDPAKKCVVLTSFLNDGGMSVFRWEGGKSAFDGSLIGKTLRAAETLISENGDVEEKKWTVRVLDKSKIELQVGDGPKLVMERQ